MYSYFSTIMYDCRNINDAEDLLNNIKVKKGVFNTRMFYKEVTLEGDAFSNLKRIITRSVFLANNGQERQDSNITLKRVIDKIMNVYNDLIKKKTVVLKNKCFGPTFEMKACATGINTLQIKLKEIEMRLFIEDFVTEFFHPYISGQITRETEEHDRKSMMELLTEKIGDIESFSYSDIETMAYNAYLKKAAQGLYVHYGLSMSEIIKIKSEEFDALERALKEATPKDFPNKILSEQRLSADIKEALLEVNDERNEWEAERKMNLASSPHFSIANSKSLFE